MLSDAKNGMFDIVICHKVDRFARNRIESAINKHNLQKCKVKVVFSGQSIDDTPEGQLMEGILESFAEYYSLNLAKEIMKGMTQNALKCKFNGGYLPFGYSTNDKQEYVINDDEAYFVKKIFRMYSENKRYSDIIAYLNESNAGNKFNRIFSPSSLHDILCNEKYIGVYAFNKRQSRTFEGKRNNRSTKDENEIIRVVDGIPAIIEKELFIEVQSMMDTKKRATRKSKETYLLSGLIVCGTCGKPYCGNRRSNGYKYYADYRCNGRCGNSSRSKDVIEELALNSLIQNVFSEDALQQLANKLNEYAKSKRTEETQRIDFIKNRLKEIQDEQNNIVSAIMKGYDNPIFKQKLNECEVETKTLKYEYESLKIKIESFEITPKQINEKLKEQRSSVINKNLVECKHFISNYIEGIIINGDESEVILKFGNVRI